MGAVMARRDVSTEPLILSDSSDVRNESIAQNAQRAADLVKGTVMAQITATRLWTPWINVAGVDGSAIPRGILLDDILTAELVAGIVADIPILVGNARVNESLVVFDGDTLSADSIIGAGTIHAVTGREALMQTSDIRLELTVAISEHENI
jgi:hypothetical protein